MNIRSLNSVRIVVFVLASALAIIVSALIVFDSHTPKQRALLFQDPISNIQNIKISPGDSFSLVKRDIEITNVDTIRSVVASIRSAKTYFPNHPATDWSCILTISSSSKKSFLEVVKASGQGAILYCTISPNGGCIYDTLQSDTMGQILEAAILKR
jgi:hypothetical protein